MSWGYNWRLTNVLGLLVFLLSSSLIGCSSSIGPTFGSLCRNDKPPYDDYQPFSPIDTKKMTKVEPPADPEVLEWPAGRYELQKAVIFQVTPDSGEKIRADFSRLSEDRVKELREQEEAKQRRKGLTPEAAIPDSDFDSGKDLQLQGWDGRVGCVANIEPRGRVAAAVAVVAAMTIPSPLNEPIELTVTTFRIEVTDRLRVGMERDPSKVSQKLGDFWSGRNAEYSLYRGQPNDKGEEQVEMRSTFVQEGKEYEVQLVYRVTTAS